MIAFALLLAMQDTSRLTLDAAVRGALSQYPTVAVARAAQSRARADVRETGAQQLPRVTLDGSATRYQLPALIYPLHGFPGPTTPAPGGNPVFDRTLFQGSALLSWTFYDFGARSGRTRATRELAGAADAALGAAEQTLVARTAGAYLRVLSARQVLAAQDQRIAAISAESERTRRLLAEGKIARIELLRADATLARASAERSAIAGQLDVVEHDLSQLTAQPWERLTRGALAAVALRDSGDAEPLRAERAALVQHAAETSPELLEVRRRAAAGRAGVAAARATRLPELRASAGIVDRASSSSEFRAEWQAGIGVSYPLYTGGQRGGAIARAEADARGAAEQLRLAEFSVAQNVDRAIAVVIEAHARVLALRTASVSSDTVAAIERTALDIGSGIQINYLEALAFALQARSQLIEARHTEIAARIELARVTGDLSPAWLATHLESVP